MNIPKAVIFDLDGVLVNTEPLKAESHSNAISELGGEASSSLYYNVMGSEHAIVRDTFINASKLNIEPDTYDKQYNTIYEKLISKKVSANAGVTQLLNELVDKAYKIAVVSSSSRWMIDLVLTKTDLQKYFNVIISADDVKKKKPAPDAYLKALEKLSVPSENAVVFEDTDAGVKAADSAGIKVIAIRHEYNTHHKFSEACSEFSSFTDTDEIMKAIQKTIK